MTKCHFIALADAVRLEINGRVETEVKAYNLCRVVLDDLAHNIQVAVSESLADFCQSQNPRFDRARWLDYIAGKCGPNGGKSKAKDDIPTCRFCGQEWLPGHECA
jgi:hypothetical protein